MLDLLVINHASKVALHFLVSAVSGSMIIAFGIYISSQYSPRYVNFRFTAAILDFQLNYLSNNVGVSNSENFGPENMG
jgi:hypothetical protein